MISIERDELRSIRMRIAVGICERYPSLYSKVYGKYRRPLSDREFDVADILIGLIRLEPCLKIVLDFINLKK